MTQPPRVSMVVPSRTGDVRALQAQLRQQTFRDWELIVNTEPGTPGLARNRGAAQARGPYLIFFDDDVQLGHESLLADLVSALITAGPLAAIGVPCRLTPEANRFQRRAFAEAVAEFAPAYGQRLTPVGWEDSVNGRCMAMHRATFEALGGFDDAQPTGEEPELLYRLTRRGGQAYLLSTSWVYFAPPPDLRTSIRKTLWYEQGNVALVRKHPEARHRLWLRHRWHAAGYLALRTLALPVLLFLRVSYRYRRPRLAFRPTAALVSYIGAWAYCRYWFAAATCAGAAVTTPRPSSPPGAFRPALRATGSSGGPQGGSAAPACQGAVVSS